MYVIRVNRVALKEEIRSLKKEVKKEMDHLRDIYAKIDRIEKGQKAAPKRRRRLIGVESELKAKLPNAEFDKSLLKLVGTASYKNPPSRDKSLIRKTIAEKYE